MGSTAMCSQDTHICTSREFQYASSYGWGALSNQLRRKCSRDKCSTWGLVLLLLLLLLVLVLLVLVSRGMGCQ
jgi:hypothetical protein